jgi:DNA-binding transcriptional LysR family regulator
VLAIGSEVTLWQPLLLDWVVWMRRSLPEIALRVQVDVPQDLITQVAAGLVDVAVMYAPPHRPGLKIDLLLEEKLIPVTTNPKESTIGGSGYVGAGWGHDFARDFSASFPEAASPGLFANLGPLALAYILSEGGCGYFRMHAVAPYIASGRLHIVPGMPQFDYPIYAVYSSTADDSLLSPALAGLRAVSSKQSEESLVDHTTSPTNTASTEESRPRRGKRRA